MNTNRRYATFQDNDRTSWIVYPNRRAALKAQEHGVFLPGTAREITFDEILTERQMIKRGMLR